MTATIAPRDLASLIEKDSSLRVLDVRTPVEYRAAHVAQARLVPLDELDRAAVDRTFGEGDAPVYVLCKAGGRARKACEKLASQGLGNAVVVEGGTDGWIAAGLPVERGRAAISLERQVRIAVGALNLTAAIMALAVHPWFAGLCAFFGAGLLFAGVADWCGMGLLLARMPWNRGGA